MWTVDSVKIGDYFPLLSVALLKAIMGSCHALCLNLKVTFCRLLKFSLFSFIHSCLQNLSIQIFLKEKKVTKVNCLDFKIVTYRPYRLVRRPVFYRMQAHKSKGREECHILFLSYLNQCYRSPCLPVLRCCLQCQTLQWQNN